MKLPKPSTLASSLCFSLILVGVGGCTESVAPPSDAKPAEITSDPKIGAKKGMVKSIKNRGGGVAVVPTDPAAAPAPSK